MDNKRIELDKLLENLSNEKELSDEDIFLSSVISNTLNKKLYEIDFNKIDFKTLIKIRKILEVENNPMINEIITSNYLFDFIKKNKSLYTVGEDEVW